MDLRKMTSSSDLNIAMPLRCPFHALAIVQVGFAGAKIKVSMQLNVFNLIYTQDKFTLPWDLCMCATVP